MNVFFPQENTELLLLNIFSILSLMLLLFKEDTTNSELIFFFSHKSFSTVPSCQLFLFSVPFTKQQKGRKTHGAKSFQ